MLPMPRTGKTIHLHRRCVAHLHRRVRTCTALIPHKPNKPVPCIARGGFLHKENRNSGYISARSVSEESGILFLASTLVNKIDLLFTCITSTSLPSKKQRVFAFSCLKMTRFQRFSRAQMNLPHSNLRNRLQIGLKQVVQHTLDSFGNGFV